MHYSHHHIHVVITMQPEGNQQCLRSLKGVYGHLNVARCSEFWSLIKSLKDHEDQSWLVLRDFNEIFQQSKKLGDKDRSERQIRQFQEVLETCDLGDLGFSGYSFTWCNNIDKEDHILERLNCCLAKSH